MALTALQTAARLALESNGGTSYQDEEDEVGYRTCCRVVSYKEHEADCWVVQLRAALDAELAV